MTAKRLNDPRGQILQAIRDSMRTRGYPPSIREIAAVVGLASTSSVRHHLLAMAEDGLIHRDPDKPRALVIADIYPSEDIPVKTKDPIKADLDRGRTALRDASMAYGVFVAGGSANRSGQEAGEHARRELHTAIKGLTAACESLDAALANETAPAATGAASNPQEGDHLE